MAKDVLDKELTVSGKLEENGIKAGTNSRFAVAIDRLGGNIADFVNLLFEPGNRKKRAISDAEVKVIEAAATAAAKAVKEDPQTAARVISGMVGAAVRKQDNKDGVLQEALEDLRSDPPSDAQAANEAPLTEEFLSRFERYAEDATTDELQKRWGRVLASEVRTPGTFSRKVLRVVDELDSRTAQSFENLCRHRLSNVIPKVLAGELNFATLAALVSADLIVEAGLGQRQISAEISDGQGVKLWFFIFGSRGLAVGADAAVTGQSDTAPLQQLGDPGPAVPVFVLTETGVALSSILEDHQADALRSLAKLVAKQVAPSIVRTYARDGRGNFIMTAQLEEPAAP